MFKLSVSSRIRFIRSCLSRNMSISFKFLIYWHEVVNNIPLLSLMSVESVVMSPHSFLIMVISVFSFSPITSLPEVFIDLFKELILDFLDSCHQFPVY